jgi:hypothetical protein
MEEIMNLGRYRRRELAGIAVLAAAALGITTGA